MEGRKKQRGKKSGRGEVGKEYGGKEGRKGRGKEEIEEEEGWERGGKEGM